LLIDVIIFSKGRESELRASLDSLSQSNLRVLVFHNNQRELQIPRSYKNIEYVGCAGMPLSQRAKLATDYLVSPFSIICSDDDRIVTSQLMRMQQSLEQNPQLASIGGSVIGVYKYGNRITGSIAYSEMQNYESVLDSPLNRIEMHVHLGNKNRIPRAGMYRLYRRQHMNQLLTLLGNCSEISTPYVYEVASEFMAAYSGKSVYINSVYWLRNWQTKMISNASWDRNLDFCDWWENPKFFDEVKRFTQILADSVQLEFDEAKRLLEIYCAHRRPFVKKPAVRTLAIPSVFHKIKIAFNKWFAPERLPIDFSDLIRIEFPNHFDYEYQELEELARGMLSAKLAKKTGAKSD
jgi:hypothetical protein